MLVPLFFFLAESLNHLSFLSLCWNLKLAGVMLQGKSNPTVSKSDVFMMKRKRQNCFNLDPIWKYVLSLVQNKKSNSPFLDYINFQVEVVLFPEYAKGGNH